MPVDKKKEELRSILAGKTTEELEELLALDFTEEEDVEPNVDYIMTILEVIDEREGNTEEKRAKTEAAWREFKEYYQLRMQEEALEAGATGEPSHDHPCKTEYGQKPRRFPHVLRYCAVVAIAAVMLCGTAFGWNIFQALADWTAETFHFFAEDQENLYVDNNPFENMMLEVSEKTDIQAVPKWAPEGTESVGKVEVSERSSKIRIAGQYSLSDESVFSVRVTIHDLIPDDYSGAYQKDENSVQEYVSGGITHYIVTNNENASAMWTNGYLEGHIQGNLSIKDLQRMIDSIYEE